MAEGNEIGPADIVRVGSSAVSLTSALLFALTASCLCGGMFVLSMDSEDEPALCNGAGFTEAEMLSSARHEAGHTIVALALHPEWFQQTDLFPYGIDLGGTCATGVTSLVTPSDMSRDDMRDWIAILYGGYVVDLSVHGQAMAGSSRDIRVATLVALEAVDAMGMGESTPPYNFEALRDEGIVLGAHVDEMRAMEVRRMLDEAIGLAIAVLSENDASVESLATALATSPTLTLTPDAVLEALSDRSVVTEDDPLQSYE